MKKSIILILLLSIGTLVAVIIYIYSIHLISNSLQYKPICANVSFEEVLNKSAIIDAKVDEYTVDQVQIFRLSSEGGLQTSYSASLDKRVKVNQIFLGETGKSETDYYYDKGSLFLVKKSNFEYSQPLFIDSSGKVKTIDEKIFLLENNQVCKWYLNNMIQENNIETQELINFLIENIVEN